MICLMASFAKGNQVVWAITSSLSALYVMHIQDFIFTLTLTMLASMIISKQYVFTHIEEIKLFSLLVFTAGYTWIINLLYIKSSRFNYNISYR